MRRSGALPRPRATARVAPTDALLLVQWVLFSLSLLHFSLICGILGMFNLTLKEFSPWKP